VAEGKRGNRPIVTYAVVGAAVVTVGHLGGGAHGTQGGYVEHPVLRFAGLVVWGAVVGGSIGWLARALPPRAEFPLGLGAIVAAVGFLGGFWYAVNVVGESVLDGNPKVQLVCALVGGGAGWAIGATAGVLLTHAEPRPSRTDAWRTRGVAFAVMAIGALAAWWDASGERPWRRADHLGGFIQDAYLVDAALVAMTLLVVAGVGRRPHAETSSPDGIGGFVNGIGKAGMGLGCFVLVAALAAAPQARSASQTPRRTRANYRTLNTLTTAASRYMDERGDVPPGFGSLRRFGARELGGTVVASVEPLEDGVCIVVGTEHEGIAVDPFVSGVVYLPKTHGDLSEQAGIGIIPPCR
jgi:hypothetical protein